MTIVENRVIGGEALTGNVPGDPSGPAGADIWTTVVERLDPVRTRPVLRPGVEHAECVSARGVPYAMIKSPDPLDDARYLRLSVEEWRLAGLMDGSRTVARLVAEFVRIAERLAPDQVARVVADLAANRMLATPAVDPNPPDLQLPPNPPDPRFAPKPSDPRLAPVPAEAPVNRSRRFDLSRLTTRLGRSLPLRLGRGIVATGTGRRLALASADPLVGFLHRIGGRLLFTRVGAGCLSAVMLIGLAMFGRDWWRGEQSVFLAGGSYAVGAVALLGLNVLALACHETGRALATRHAGRRVGAAGLLLRSGIPSVFIDTSDGWMAGRRARMITAASGPAAALVLAGVTQLIGLLLPQAAPWAFKLAFVCYLDVLLSLSPFRALDGNHLLAEWLETPHLRARGLAYLKARLRRRPPGWGQLDREGRLAALYGILAVLWLVIVVNIGWRLWTDRVAGLVAGLWPFGWLDRLLLAAVVGGLAGPLVQPAVSWLIGRCRQARARWAERDEQVDLPRRIEALRRSSLRWLPAPALAKLAGRARWLHPRSGQQLVVAGADSAWVHVVVDGALEARLPSDPAGTVRQRLYAGGIAGLGNALTATPAALSWYATGARLLAVPAPAVALAVGPLAGPRPADRAAADALFREAPALQNLAVEDRLGLIGASRAAVLAPGDPITLSGANDVAVIESGVVALADGTELERGTMIGPTGWGDSNEVAVARTFVQLWYVPAVSGLPLLLGAPRPVTPPHTGTPVAGGSATMPALGGASAHASGAAASSAGDAPLLGPAAGIHPARTGRPLTPDAYPPLTVPPGPPPAVDARTDRRFERGLWRLVLLLLLLGLLATGSGLAPGPAWAEMPADRALLRVDRNRVVVTTAGRATTLDAGEQMYVGPGDRIQVNGGSAGILTFRGGAATVLCAGADATVGALWTEGLRPAVPGGVLTLGSGRILVDTGSTSAAFRPLALTVNGPARAVGNLGAAWFAVSVRDVTVSSGAVRVAGTVPPATGRALDCGDGRPLPRPSGAPISGVPSDAPGSSPSPSGSARPTGSPWPAGPPRGFPPSPLPTAAPTATTPTGQPSTWPSTGEPTDEPTGEPTYPGDDPPRIAWVDDPGGAMSQLADGSACSPDYPTQVHPVVAVTDEEDFGYGLRVSIHWGNFATGSAAMDSSEGRYFAAVGPFDSGGRPNRGGLLEIWVTATDSAGNTSRLAGTTVEVQPCSRVPR